MINEMNDIPRAILYFTASLETQDPRKRFKAKKCIQKISRKLSVANKEYNSSIPKYNLKISSIVSSNRIIWYTRYT